MPSSSSRRAWFSVTACRKPFGAEAGPAREELLQPGRRLADLAGKRLQRRLVAIVEADLLDDPADGLVVAAGGRDVFLQDCGLCVHGKYLLERQYRRFGGALLHPFPAGRDLSRITGRLRRRQRAGESRREAFAVVGIEKGADRHALALPLDGHAGDADLGVAGDGKRAQNGLKRCCFGPAGGAPPCGCRETGAGHRDLLARPGGAVVQPEGDVDEQHVEAEKAEDRPGAVRRKIAPVTIQPTSSAPISTAKPVRPSERCGVSKGAEERLVGRRNGVCLAHGRQIIEGRWKSPSRNPRAAPASAAAPRRHRAGKRAGPARRSLYTPAEVAEIFRRFSVQRPEPKGELEHVNRLHPARGGRAFGAGDRRRRQQGDARAVRGGRHAAKDARHLGEEKVGA